MDLANVKGCIYVVGKYCAINQGLEHLGFEHGVGWVNLEPIPCWSAGTSVYSKQHPSYYTLRPDKLCHTHNTQTHMNSKSNREVQLVRKSIPRPFLGVAGWLHLRLPWTQAIRHCIYLPLALSQSVCHTLSHLANSPQSCASQPGLSNTNSFCEHFLHNTLLRLKFRIVKLGEMACKLIFK